MLLTCALQEGGVITNQASLQPITGKSHTTGRSYYTTTGADMAVTTKDDRSDVAMATGSFETGKPVTIDAVKIPTSPLEPVPGVSDVISGDDIRGGEVRMLDLPPVSPPDKLSLSPAPSSGHLGSRTSPYVARVVC